MSYISLEEFEEMIENTSYQTLDSLDVVLEGAKVLSKYLGNNVFQGAEHDIIYSGDVEDIIEKGLTKEDAQAIADFGWFINEETESLAHFV